MLNIKDIRRRLYEAGAEFVGKYMDADEFVCIEFVRRYDQFGRRCKINYDLIRDIALPDWEQAEIYDNMIRLFPTTLDGFNEYIRLYQTNFKTSRRTALIGLEIVLGNYASEFVRNLFFSFNEPTKHEILEIQRFETSKKVKQMA